MSEINETELDPTVADGEDGDGREVTSEANDDLNPVKIDTNVELVQDESEALERFDDAVRNESCSHNFTTSGTNFNGSAEASPINTQRDVIYYISHNYGDKGPYNKVFPDKDSPNQDTLVSDFSNATPRQSNDVNYLLGHEGLLIAQDKLQKHNIIIIRQTGRNRRLCGDIIRKIRYDWRDQFCFRDTNTAIDLAQYYRHPDVFEYEDPTVTIVDSKLNTDSVASLLYEEEYRRIQQSLSESRHHLVVLTQLDIQVLKEKLAISVDSPVFHWCPEVIQNTHSHTDKDTVDALFNDELRIKPYIVFMLAFFPGLDLAQFNDIIATRLEQQPEWSKIPSPTPVTKDNAVDNETDSSQDTDKSTREKSDPEPKPTILNWDLDGDKTIRACQGAYLNTDDSNGYCYQSVEQSQWLQDYLLKHYPNYCRQQYQALFDIYFSAPKHWGGFRETFRNCLPQFIDAGLIYINSAWLRETYNRYRLNSRHGYGAYWAFIELNKALWFSKSSANQSSDFMQQLGKELIADQETWALQLIAAQQYHHKELRAFLECIADFYTLLSNTCGLSDPFAFTFFSQFLATSQSPFSLPSWDHGQEDKEAIIFPLGWYSKIQWQRATNFQPHLYYLLVNQLTNHNEIIGADAPLRLRANYFISYFCFVDRVSNNDDQVATFLHHLLDQEQYQTAIIKLIKGQLKIVADLRDQETYQQWLSYIAILMFNMTKTLTGDGDLDISSYKRSLTSFFNQLLSALERKDQRVIQKAIKDNQLQSQNCYRRERDRDQVSPKQAKSARRHFRTAQALRRMVRPS